MAQPPKSRDKKGEMDGGRRSGDNGGSQNVWIIIYIHEIIIFFFSFEK